MKKYAIKKKSFVIGGIRMLKAEKNYEFRQRMRVLHRRDRRCEDIVATADEITVESGWQVVLPAAYGEVVLTAAQDLQEYLFVSMKVSVMLAEARNDAPAIALSVDTEQTEDYIITIDDGIAISGKSERGLAQGIYCLEDRMNAKQAPILKKETIRHTFLFSPRMVHSGYALDEYPNEHLSAIAHAGMDAILVFVKGVNMTPKGFLDFNELITRANRYGLDVYAYSYMKSEMNPEGEEGQAYYDALYGKLFEACPRFKGVVLVGESVGFPSRDPHVAPANDFYAADGIPYTKPRSGFWPCQDYPLWLEAVKRAVYRYKAEADIVFWTYNWGYVEEEARVELIRALPTDISLMVTFEMFESYKMDGFVQTTADYTLASAGPGSYFLSEARAAKERGIRLYAQANTGGLTWDMGTIPYEPMPYQWMERYRGMREAHDKYGLCGVMESHHYGLFPSLVSDLTKRCFIRETDSMEAELAEIVRARFGKGNEQIVCEALKLWSEAIRHYTPTDADQYGAFRVGPSYPLCLIRSVKPPAAEHAPFGNEIMDPLYPADYSPVFGLPSGRGEWPSLRVAGEIRSLEKMKQYMVDGGKLLQTVADPNEELQYLINLGEYIECCVQTGIHAKQWYVAKARANAVTEREQMREQIGVLRSLVAAERANAERAIPLVERDSRLGWEPSMEYIGDAEHIQWKLRHLKYVEDFEIECYENGIADRWFQ